MSIVYPTLAPEDLQSAFERLQAEVGAGRPVRPFPDGRLPSRTLYEAPGPHATKPHLDRLRQRLLEAFAADLSRSGRESDRRFDIVVGRALDHWFSVEGRSQAARPEVWAFLTIIVLPDLAVARFPADSAGRLSQERFLRGRRNVFARAYQRAWIFGDLLEDPDLPVYEDELVGLVDRSLSVDHRVSRAMAGAIRRLPQGAGRRDAVREGLKALQFELRVTDVGGFSEEELARFAHRLMLRR